MNTRRLVIPGLLLVTVIIDALAIGQIFDWSWETEYSIVFGACASQLTLAGIWLGLGTGLPGPLRLAVAGGVVFGWAVAVAIRTQSPLSEWANNFLVPLAGAAGVALIYRLIGFRWQRLRQHADRPILNHRERRWQFSLAQILGWTTAAAVLAYLTRFVTLAYLRAFEIFAVHNMANATAILYLARQGGRLWIRLTCAAMASLFIATTLSLLLGDSLFLYHLLLGLTLFTWIKICEFGGYGIVRWDATPAEPSDNSLMTNDEGLTENDQGPKSKV